MNRFVSALVCWMVAATGFAGQAVAQNQSATFEVTLDITWGPETAPYEFPENGGHLTKVIGATHHSRFTMFRDGDTASSGMELIAENGRAGTMNAEFAEGQRRRRVGTVFEGPRLDHVPDTISFTVTTTDRHTLLSFATMLAPSPDWFTGLADVPLRDDAGWIADQSHALWAWDSGTDSAQTYIADNDDTQPQQSVRLLATPHFLTQGGLVPMGTARIKQVAP